jgi:signal transduction histidine kinase
VKNIINHKDRIEEIRHSGLVYYCFYHIVYSLFLLGYGIIVPEYMSTFTTLIVVTLPLNILTIYYSRHNYCLAGKIYVCISFILMVSYLFMRVQTEALSSIAVVQFFAIAIVALIVIDTIWSVSLFGLGIISLIVDYVIFYNGDFGQDVPTVHNFDSTLLNSLNIACMFGYFVFFVKAFVEYYKLYTNELKLRTDLNNKLQRTNENLYTLNHELEEHVSALEEANSRFNRYSWMNSHTLRAPIARILGLIAVSKFPDEIDNRSFINEKILEATVELDKVVKEMNGLLEDSRSMREPW